MDLERIRQLLANVATLSPEDLTALKEGIDAEYDRLDADENVTAELVTSLDTLADGAEAVRGEEERRAAEAAEIAQKAQTAKERMRLLRNPPAPEAKPDDAGPDDGETQTAPADGTPPVETGDVAPVEPPLPIAASAVRGDPRTMPQRMAQATGRAAPSPTATATGFGPSSAHIVAAAGMSVLVDGEYIGPNTPLTSEGQLARAMSETLITMQGTHDHAKHVVASAMWTLPEDRQLGRDTEQNTQRIEAVCGLRAPRNRQRNRRGPDGAVNVVATGGICLPVNVDYSVPTWSTADRPLRDGLPSFQATRGGIQFVTPPDIGINRFEPGGPTGAGTATSVWTEATDANPSGATKPVWSVACGSVETVLVDAVPTRVEFGNMLSRFAPEQVAANTQQAVAQAARTAEINLLEKMYAASKAIPLSQYLGASRDILTGLGLLKEQYLYTHRVPETVTFTIVFPRWVKELFRSDLTRELAHDNTNTRDVMAITDEQIEAWMAVRGFNCIWTLEGVPAGTYGTGSVAISNQGFNLAVAGSAPQWPGQASNAAFQLAGLMYIEGTFQHLDGGRLDLGVVRDSLLDSTNDYETFVEVFESIAFRGLEVYQPIWTLLPTGGSGATVAASNYHE